MIQILLIIILSCLLVLAQSCSAGQDENEIEKVIREFHRAWRNRDMLMMDEIWSHEDDARFIFYTTDIPENNFDVHCWNLVKSYISAGVNMGFGGPSEFDNVTINFDERGAAVSFDCRIGEPHSKKGFALLRKEDGKWKIYLFDLTGLLADKTGNETGDYVEIAFEAESGKNAEKFLGQDAKASKGEYIINMEKVSFEFNIPVQGKYTIWGRTLVTNSDQNSFNVTIDNVTNRWDVGVSLGWVWNQINRKLNMGPSIYELGNGKHNLAISMCEFGTKLDAIYITNNLDLWAEQIPRRFDLTMGYIEKPKALEKKGKLITTWAEIR